MKKLLRIISVLVIISVFMFVLIACQDRTKNNYTMVAPDGAPTLALMNIFGKEINSSKIDYSIVSASVIRNSAVQSDLAIVPSNLAANIYNSGSDYKLIATVTFGNLYMISSSSSPVENIEDLKGKMVFSIGQGSVPDLVFKTVLKNNNISFEIGDAAKNDTVVLKYFADGQAVIAQLAAAKQTATEAYGILGEPAVSNAISKGFTKAFDLQKLYGGQDGYSYAQAVLIASKKAYEDSDFIAKLCDEMSKNSEYVRNSYGDGIKLIKEKYPDSSLPNVMSEETIQACNLGFKTAEEYKDEFVALMNDIYNINPQIIGGKLPDNDFYYKVG